MAQVWPRPILAALRQWPGCVWAYRLGPCGPNDATNLSDVHMYPWFVRLMPSFIQDPSWPSPCEPVEQQTHQMFIIYLVQDFYAFGLPTEAHFCPVSSWSHLAASMGLGVLDSEQQTYQMFII